MYRPFLRKYVYTCINTDIHTHTLSLSYVHNIRLYCFLCACTLQQFSLPTLGIALRRSARLLGRRGIANFVMLAPAFTVWVHGGEYGTQSAHPHLVPKRM